MSGLGPGGAQGASWPHCSVCGEEEPGSAPSVSGALLPPCFHLYYKGSRKSGTSLSFTDMRIAGLAIRTSAL